MTFSIEVKEKCFGKYFLLTIWPQPGTNLIWKRSHHQLDQHSVERMCNNTFSFWTSETWGLMPDWTFLCMNKTLQDHGWLLHSHFSVPCWFLKQNSIFFSYVFKDARCRTRTETDCQDAKWVPWWGLRTWCWLFLSFEFFLFIIFQNRSAFEDMAIIHLTKHIQHPFSYSQLLIAILLLPSSTHKNPQWDV